MNKTFLLIDWLCVVLFYLNIEQYGECSKLEYFSNNNNEIIEFEEVQKGLPPTRFKELFRHETDPQILGKTIRTWVIKKISN